MAAAGYAGYRNVIAHTTKNKAEILLMLYEGAITSLRTARSGIAEKNPRIKGENISKVLAILTELDCALDMEKGGELAENMAGIYRYMINRLGFANCKNDPETLREVERLLGELYEGFKGAAKLPAAGPVNAKTAELKMTEGMSIAI